MTREEINKRIMQACKNMWNEKICKEIEETLEQETILDPVVACKDCIHSDFLGTGFYCDKKKYV